MGLKQNLYRKKLEQELQIKGGVVVVDISSCDGCGSCVDTCPQTAISIITLSRGQIKDLPFKGRLKVRLKGANKAFINPELCVACGKCMLQCHEFAIHKVKQQIKSYESIEG